MREQGRQPHDHRYVSLVRALAIFGIAMMAAGFVGMTGLPRWWFAPAGTLAGVSILWLVILAVWIRAAGITSQGSQSAREWRPARRGAWAAFVAAGALWVLVLFMVTPNVVGAWSIGGDPTRSTGELDAAALIERGPDTVTYRVDGEVHEASLAPSLTWTRSSNPYEPIVLDPDEPTHVMLEQDWRDGRDPLSLSAVVAGNALFAGAGLYVRHSRRR